MAEKIDIAELHRLLNYDPITGHVTWKVRKRNGVKIGDVCGHVASNGYLRMMIHKKSYAVHQIAFAMYYGRWSKDEVDHINGVKLDNRIANLREATGSENQYNKVSGCNTSGFKGVGFNKRLGKYRAIIKKDKKSVYLGSFDDPQEAAHAYNKAAIALHGEFAQLNPIGSDYV